MDDKVLYMLAQARGLYAEGDYGKAEGCLEEVLKHTRGFADVHNMLGMIYHQHGQHVKAMKSFEEALAVNPRYTDAALNLVVVYNELGKFKEGRKVYEQALAHARSSKGGADPFVTGKIANMYSDIGDVFFANGDYTAARAEYERALALRPNFHDIRCKVAATYRDEGDLESAERILRRVVGEAPRYTGGRIQLGLVFYLAGKRDEARQQWEDALKQDPENQRAGAYLRMLSGQEGLTEAKTAPNI